MCNSLLECSSARLHLAAGHTTLQITLSGWYLFMSNIRLLYQKLVYNEYVKKIVV
jgi:hypothetical protein